MMLDDMINPLLSLLIAAHHILHQLTCTPHYALQCSPLEAQIDGNTTSASGGGGGGGRRRVEFFSCGLK